MEVILLENIGNLGELGDRVRVKAGYGRNYLVPQGKAVPATAENIAAFDERRAELERRQAEIRSAAEARAGALAGKAVTVAAKVGSEGKLFGSVGTAEIAEAVNAMGVELHKREVRLSAGPLRETGEHEVELHLQAGIDVTLKVIVVGEDAASG